MSRTTPSYASGTRAAGGTSRLRRRRRRQLRTAMGALLLAVIAAAVFGSFGGGGGGRHPSVAAPKVTAPPVAPTGAPTTVAPAPQHVQIGRAAVAMPAAVSRAAVVSDGRTLVVLGGLVGKSPGTSTAVVTRFDPAAGTVTRLAPSPRRPMMRRLP